LSGPPFVLFSRREKNQKRSAANRSSHLIECSIENDDAMDGEGGDFDGDEVSKVNIKHSNNYSPSPPMAADSSTRK
jgi:hypothetical protein